MCHIFIQKFITKVKLFMLKTKQGEVIKSQYQKELFTLIMFQKNKQNKLTQTKNNGIKEKRYLNYTILVKYAFRFLIFLFFIR